MSWIPGRKYFAGGVCNIKRDLTGQVVIVTGSSSGIGRETAKGLAAMNATVIMANRNQAKTEPIMEGIKKETGNPNVEFIQMDLEDLKSVREFVRSFKKKHQHLHILVNNAGINTMSPQREFTKDGFERNVGANYLGHYYLTRLLSNTLINSQPSRIINVLTKGATKQRLEWDNLMSEKKFDNFKALFQSKIASLMFATELQQRFQGSNVKVVNLHPGWVKTESWADMKAPLGTRVMINTLSFFLNYFGKDPREGAQTSLYCAVEDFSKLKSGAFYSDCEEFNFTPTQDLNEENRKKLWEMSEQWIKEKLGEDAFEN